MGTSQSTANFIPGIDVSHYQAQIEWDKVAAAGIRYCFIKASEGDRFTDDFFPDNWDAAKGAGVIRGAYHFFRPKVDVGSQVENFVNKVGALTSGDLPPALDVEIPEDWTGIPPAEAVQHVTKWLQQVELWLGAKPIIYV